jgi:DHA1 family bicyclomycin/chloramphenicol resistance-like MFS transporter
VMPVVPIGRAIAMMLGSRQTVGYMLALGFLFGSLLIYVSTARQMFEDIYGVVDWFPALFACAAGGMVVSSVMNSRYVRKVGMRPMSHRALVALVVLMGAVNLLHLALPVLPLAVLVPVFSVAFFFVGLILPNFNALAMEPLGPIAGTGSAFVGFVMTGMGALLGGLVGQSYDGTLGPLLFGFFAYAAVVLAIVAVTEGGRLGQPSALGAPAE